MINRLQNVSKSTNFKKLTLSVLYGSEKFVNKFLLRTFYKNYVPEYFLQLVETALYYSTRAVLIGLLRHMSALAIVTYYTDYRILYYAPHSVNELRLNAVKVRNISAYRRLCGPTRGELILAIKMRDKRAVDYMLQRGVIVDDYVQLLIDMYSC